MMMRPRAWEKALLVILYLAMTVLWVMAARLEVGWQWVPLAVALPVVSIGFLVGSLLFDRRY